MPNPIDGCVSYQRQLLNLLEEFFVRWAGVPASEFATFDTFSREVRSQAHQLATRSKDAFNWADDNIPPFYVNRSAAARQNASELHGLKLMQGGGSRFKKSQFDSLRGSLLYGDTVIIPDPVLPWFEISRDEEQFQHVLLMEMVFGVLHLKPIVDAELPTPAVFVFPSLEKSLEENDSQTKNATLQLLTDLIAHFVDPNVSNIQEVTNLIQTSPQHFMAQVEANNLFVAPGCAIGESLGDALEHYEIELRRWRSREWLENYQKSPPEIRVFNHQRLAHHRRMFGVHTEDDGLLIPVPTLLQVI
jgi:hypothetical protein